jgi:hypothetical protein
VQPRRIGGHADRAPHPRRPLEPQIGARLFLSSQTVEWHLRHVFTKLGIRSRRELSHVLAVSLLAGERWRICAREFRDGTLLPLDGTRRCAVASL